MGLKLAQLVKDINKEHGEELLTIGPKKYTIDRIPFTSPRVNYMLYGGLPLGRVTEIFGPENGGKTTTSLVFVAQAQAYAEEEFEREMADAKEALEEAVSRKAGKKELDRLEGDIKRLTDRGVRQVVYIDHENTLDLNWAALLGVDLSKLYLMQPQEQTAEAVLQILLDILDTGEVILVVLDSIPALVPKSIYEKEMDEKSYCGSAGPLTTFSQKVPGKISRHNTAIILTNQVREDMVNTYNQYKTPGGRALKHLCGLRLYVQRGTFLDKDNNELKMNCENPYGNFVDVRVVKTKVCRPDRRIGGYTLHYTTGVDVVADTLHMALMYEIFAKNGAWYYYIDPSTGETFERDGELMRWQGEANVLDALRDDDNLFDEVYSKVMDKLQAKDDE